MTGVRELLLNQLDPLERVVAASLIEIPATRIDEARSRVWTTVQDLVICEISSADDSCCPFKLFFHRGKGRYSWFIGLGEKLAETSNYEEVDTPALASEAAHALMEFLESTVHCELVERVADGHVVSATYTMSRWVADDGMLGTHGVVRGGGFLRKKSRRVIEYTPWIDRSMVP